MFRAILDRMDGREIQIGRVLAGIRTQRELAAILGVSVKTVNNWENDRTGLKPGEAERLRRLFDERQKAASAGAADVVTEALAAASDAQLIQALANRLAMLRSLIPEDVRAMADDADTDAVIEGMTAFIEAMQRKGTLGDNDDGITRS